MAGNSAQTAVRLLFRRDRLDLSDVGNNNDDRIHRRSKRRQNGISALRLGISAAFLHRMVSCSIFFRFFPCFIASLQLFDVHLPRRKHEKQDAESPDDVSFRLNSRNFCRTVFVFALKIEIIRKLYTARIVDKRNQVSQKNLKREIGF